MHHPLKRCTHGRTRALLMAACLCLALAQARAQSAEPPMALRSDPAAAAAASAASVAAPVLLPNLGAGTTAAPPGNPYGLRVVWSQGDAVARTTLALLGLMSLLSWYLLLAKLIEQLRQARQARYARDLLGGGEPWQRAATALPVGTAVRYLADSAMEALRTYESLAGQVELGSWLEQDIVRNVSTLALRMQSGLAVLATIGSTAPFVGLFGTVWGIYNALVTIGATGQASIDKVAGPVGEALIMTALGLAVAVPAVLGYNALLRRNRLALHDLRGYASDLHTRLLIEVERERRGTPAAGRTRKG